MPSLSIIIPVRNERDHIAACLESVFAMQGVEDAKVLVIDGMSSDGTRELLAELSKRYPAMVVLDNPAKRVTTALNIGVAAASAPVIMRLDAHALYAPDYITACLRVMEQTGAANVGGHMRALPSKPGAVSHAIVMSHYSAFGLGGGRFHNVNREGYTDTVWLGCYEKKVFETVGLFTETLFRSEDIDLNARLRKAGMKIYLSSQIKAWYFCRPTLSSLFVQRFLDGRGVVQTLLVNPGAVRIRHLAPLGASLVSLAVLAWAFVSALIGNSASLVAACTAIAAGAALWIGLSVLFSLLAFLQTDRINSYIPFEQHRIKKNAALLLPFVFATLHLSYGLGSLAGLWWMWKRGICHRGEKRV